MRNSTIDKAVLSRLRRDASRYAPAWALRGRAVALVLSAFLQPSPRIPVGGASRRPETCPPAADFSDAESKRILTLAARAVAYELGREAAREYFGELLRRRGIR